MLHLEGGMAQWLKMLDSKSAYSNPPCLLIYSVPNQHINVKSKDVDTL